MGKYCRAHIGKTFNDGKLTVVDGGDKNGYVKVKCIVCANDPELFGDAVFEVQSAGLIAGKLPCGCSKSPKWTLEQYKILIERKILKESLDIKFLGFDDTTNHQPNQIPLNLLCNMSGLCYTVSGVNSFFDGCGNHGKTKSIDAYIDTFNKQSQDAIIWKVGVDEFYKPVLGYYCKTCESNDLESVYTINSNALFHNKNKPCLCSSRPKELTHEYVIRSSKELLENQYSRYLVVGAYRKNGYWMTMLLCSTHGVYSRNYNALLKTGYNCLRCNPPEYGYNTDKTGYLYVLQIQTTTGVIMGYGITNKISKRLTTHKFKLANIGATITNIQVFGGSGSAVLAAENAIKSLHNTGLLDCEGFRRESISFDRKDEVLEKCSKLKELDNADKLI